MCFHIFYFEDMGQLGQFFLNITGISMISNGSPFADQLTWNSFVNNCFLIIFAMVACMPVLPAIKKFFFENRNNTIYALGRMGSTVCCGVLLVISSILLVDSTNNPFLYWRF